MTDETRQTKALEEIARSLSSLNKNFELMIQQMESARLKLAKETCICNPSVKIGSSGDAEPKQSDK
jgi:hypothetical protein